MTETPQERYEMLCRTRCRLEWDVQAAQRTLNAAKARLSEVERSIAIMEQQAREVEQ